MTDVNVAEVVSKLTSGVLYEQLKAKDKENPYYKFCFYGTSLDTSTNDKSILQDDYRTDNEYRKWALSHNATEFMTVVMNGVETPIYVSDCIDMVLDLIEEIIAVKEKGDPATLAASVDLFRQYGCYMAGLDYWGKNVIEDYYINNNTTLAKYIKVKELFDDYVKQGEADIGKFYNKTSKKMKTDKAFMYLPSATFRPKEFEAEYKEIKDAYFNSVNEILDIIRNHPSLQFCISNVEVGDMICNNMSGSQATYTAEIESSVECMNAQGEVTGDKDEEDKQDDQNTGYTPPKEDNKNKDKPKEEDKSKFQEWLDKDNNKTIFIVCIIIVVFLLLAVGGFIIYKSTTKNNNYVQPMYQQASPPMYAPIPPRVFPQPIPQPFPVYSYY
jgi:hypothetical protein